jgi:hypothetical protein
MFGIDLKYTINWWKDALGLSKPNPPVQPPSPAKPEIVTPSPAIKTPTGVELQFNPGNVVTDEDFSNCDSMSEQDIQDFFVRKGGVILPNYSINGHLASYWFYKHSKDNGINPKVIITHLQKEQGAVTRKTPFAKQRTYDYLMGVGATDSGDNPKWAGADNQILGAVLTTKKWFDKGKLNKYPYIMSVSDRPSLPIENAATFSLYKYTPWVGDIDKQIGKNLYKVPFGNYLFWKIYNSKTFWG